MTEANLVVSEQQARQFREEGYFVLERVIPEGHLKALRSECQRFIDARDAEMDRLGVEKLDLDHKGKRYFVHTYEGSERVREFLFSELMA